MADATNEVRLWRGEDGDWSESSCGCGSPAYPHTEDGEVLTPYIARPRADDDAREERLKAAELESDIACRESDLIAKACWNAAERCGIKCTDATPIAAVNAIARDRDEWKARAEKAEAWRSLAEPQLKLRDDEIAMLLRERAEARALLRIARDSVERDYLDCDEGLTDEARAERLARIDAALRDGPTPDDRKGEDGAWCAQ